MDKGVGFPGPRERDGPEMGFHCIVMDRGPFQITLSWTPQKYQWPCQCYNVFFSKLLRHILHISCVFVEMGNQFRLIIVCDLQKNDK